MKRLVILDFDGTLGDTQSLIVHTMQQTISELQLPARTDAECAAMIGLPLKKTFTELIPMTDAEGDRCAETYRKLFWQNNKPGAVPLFPGVYDTLRQLHGRGLTLTVASSRLRESLEDYLRNLGIAPFISYIVSASDTEHAKPEPDMVLMTLRETGVEPADAIVVGDTTYDIRMAHNAGVEAVGVTYGNGRRSDMEQEKAEYIIDSFGQMLDVIGS